MGKKKTVVKETLTRKKENEKRKIASYSLALQPQMPEGYTMAERRQLREYSKSITAKHSKVVG